VIRACNELGIRTLAVYSEADVDSLHVQLADEAICIGAAPSLESYLKIDRIMSAAEIGDVDAIHPGYGFLAENPHFVEVCESCNIKFIGPSSRAMQSMGDKNAARAAARKVGVPVTPGSDGIVDTEDEAIKIAKKLGYPAAVAGCALRIMSQALNPLSIARVMRRRKHLETIRCTWRSSSSIRATLNFKSWPIVMDTSSILANAIALFNGVTKK
jgi:acetyl-CoA carboxylase biotin carboxylase subunit